MSLKTLVRHPLITGSFAVVLGSLAANVFNFLFNLFMTRSLSITDYGTLASLVSFITLFTIPAGAILPTVVRFSAPYYVEEKYASIKTLFFKLKKFSLILGVILFIIITVFLAVIAAFFHITNYNLIFYADIAIFFSYVSVVNTGFLQARQSFTFLSITSFLGAVIKFILGVAFVLGGLSVTGAMIAFVLSYAIPYFLSYIPFRPLLYVKRSTEQIHMKDIISYGIPTAITMFGLTSFITTDIILVKHFFDQNEAGLYAGLSLVGRVIFFLTAPIGTVMFPLMIKKHTKRESYHGLFFLSASLILFPSLILTVFYFLFPEFVINFFLKQKEYLQLTNLLGAFGLLATLYAVLYLVTTFYLAIKKTIVAYPIAVGAILQIVGIVLFHQNFTQVISISIAIIALLLLILLLYYVRIYATSKTN